MDKFYSATPNGYRGADDDQGQLSGWFVFASIGLYDISGGCGVDQQLYVHTPLFQKITIHLDNRNYYKSDKFTIVSKNFSDKSIYIKSAKLNGAPLRTSISIFLRSTQTQNSNWGFPKMHNENSVIKMSVSKVYCFFLDYHELLINI